MDKTKVKMSLKKDSSKKNSKKIQKKTVQKIKVGGGENNKF